MAEETDQKSKRRVRKVETVREKAVKSAEVVDQTSRGRVIWLGFTAPLRFIGRGFKKVGTVLKRFRVLRFIGNILFPRYFRNSWKELRQVTWPTARQSRQLTIAVVMFAVIFGILIALLDHGLDKLFKQVLIK